MKCAEETFDFGDARRFKFQVGLFIGLDTVLTAHIIERADHI